MRRADQKWIAVLVAGAWTLTAHAQNAGVVTGSVTLQPGGRPVPNAIIYLGGHLPASNGNGAPAVVEAQRGQLVPRVQIAGSGAALTLQNNDPLLHVVRIEEVGTNSQPRVLARVAMPYAGFEKRYALPVATEARLLRIVGENGDEGKVAYLAVLPHGWAALTDARGQFQISNAPVGEYAVYVWQEALGALAGRVTVPRQGVVTIAFQFPRGWGGSGRAVTVTARVQLDFDVRQGE